MAFPHVPPRRRILPAPIAVMLLALQPALAASAPLKIGAVTRHASRYVGKPVTLAGYLLAQEKGYVLVSDEPGGKAGHYDLPVTGPGVGDLKPKVRYVFEGRLLGKGLVAVNGDPVHLELSTPAVEAKL
jgi:hypothetical protein